MATFWIEEDSNTQSNVLTPSVAHADSRVTIKSRMRKCSVQQFKSTPKNSYTSSTPRRKSNPTPSVTSKRDTIPLVFLSSGGVPHQRSSLTSTRSTAVTSPERTGRTWSTVSEPLNIAYTLTEEDVFPA